MVWTLLLAVYGAALSTTLGVLQYRRSRRTVRLTAVPATRADDELTGNFVRVSIANSGFETVHVRSASMLVEYDKPSLRKRLRHMRRFRSLNRFQGFVRYGLPDDTHFDRELPASIEPGRNLALWVPRAAMKDARAEAKASKKIRVSVQDELDRTFVSPPLPDP